MSYDRNLEKKICAKVSGVGLAAGHSLVRHKHCDALAHLCAFGGQSLVDSSRSAVGGCL